MLRSNRNIRGRKLPTNATWTGRFNFGSYMTIPIPLSVRIEKYIQKTDTCWLWTGAKNESGYGVIWDISRKANAFAHRAMYELSVQLIPEGMFLCHHCDVPSCVRPEHLFIGTPKDNSIDSSHKGRRANQTITHCKRGHEYTEANTYKRLAGNGQRECKECAKLGQERLRRRRGVPKRKCTDEA